jgi:replicative DNA helicase
VGELMPRDTITPPPLADTGAVAEGAVLSSMCIGGMATVAEVQAAGLKPQHFVLAELGDMYRCLIEHAEQSKRKIDRGTLALRLADLWRRDGLPETNAGSHDTMAKILVANTWEATFTAHNAAFHAGKIKEAYILRTCRMTIESLSREGNDWQQTGTDYLLKAQRSLAEIANNTATFDRPTRLSEIVPGAHERFRANYADSNAGRGRVRTGIPKLDAAVKHYAPKTLNIIAARTGEGKTALAGHITYHTARTGVLPRIYSLEMSQDELIERYIWHHTGIDPSRYDDRILTEDEWRRLDAAHLWLATLPIDIVDPSRMTIAELCRDARKASYQEDIGIVVVDYLQLLRMDQMRRGANRAEVVGEISTELKGLARELNVPVIALAQLNRDSVKEKRPPSKHDIRDSGQIEQDADSVLLLYPIDKKDDADFDDPARPEGYMLYLDKMRSKRSNVKIPVNFWKSTMTFEEMLPCESPF